VVKVGRNAPEPRPTRLLQSVPGPPIVEIRAGTLFCVTQNALRRWRRIQISLNHYSWHCFNHHLELALSDAVKCCTQVNHFKCFMDTLYALYSQSPKCQRELAECAKELDVQLSRIKRVLDVRWVASSCRTVTAVWRSYKALYEHFSRRAWRTWAPKLAPGCPNFSPESWLHIPSRRSGERPRWQALKNLLKIRVWQLTTAQSHCWVCVTSSWSVLHCSTFLPQSKVYSVQTRLVSGKVEALVTKLLPSFMFHVHRKWIPAEPKDWRRLSGLNSSIWHCLAHWSSLQTE